MLEQQFTMPGYTGAWSMAPCGPYSGHVDELHRELKRASMADELEARCPVCGSRWNFTPRRA